MPEHQRIKVEMCVTAPSQSLICPICQDVFLDPVITSQCFHSFCNSCIRKAIEFDSHCSLCRRKLNGDDIHSNLALQGLINELMVYCPSRSLGCLQTITYEHMAYHINTQCQFTRKKCPYNTYGCSFFDTTIEEHLKDCPFHQIRAFIKNTDQRIAHLEKIVMDQKRVIDKIMSNGEDSSPKIESFENIVQHNWIENGMNCVKTIQTERSGITSLAYEKDGTLFCGANDGTIKVFDSFSSHLNFTLSGHNLSVWSLAIDSAHGRLFSGSSDESINVWDINTKAQSPFASFGKNQGKIYSLLLKEGRIFSASSDGTIRIWESRTFKPLGTLSGHSGGVNSLKIYRESLISASNDKTVKIWDLNTLSCTTTIASQTSEVLDLALGSNLLFCSGYDSNIHAFNLNDYSKVSTLSGHKWEVWQLEYANDVLFSGSHDHTLKIWDARNFRNTSTLTGHNGYIHSLVWTDQGTLISGSLDRSIKFWE